MKAPIAVISLCAALAVAGCGGGNDSSSGSESSGTAAAESTGAAKKTKATTRKTKPIVTVPGEPPPKQLKVSEVEIGSGVAAQPGDEVTVQYVGIDYKKGKEFDSSWGREPFRFTLGAGEVIPGWDQGIKGMRVGGRRQLIIPPELAYGEAGSPPAIGPNETLVFVVDLLEVN